MPEYNWVNVSNLPSRKYTCGYCGNPLASEKGWIGTSRENSAIQAFIYICHHCTGPTLLDHTGGQSPGVVFGNAVADIPDNSVSELYDEARKATGAGSYTAAVLCCRKLLMHIAVSKSADTGKSFADYVKYLADKHYVPPDAADWVDHIREKGNEANHEIVILAAEDAKELLAFSEMLLKVIFEFPAAVKKKKSTAPPKAAT